MLFRVRLRLFVGAPMPVVAPSLLLERPHDRDSLLQPGPQRDRASARSRPTSKPNGALPEPTRGGDHHGHPPTDRRRQAEHQEGPSLEPDIILI